MGIEIVNLDDLDHGSFAIPGDRLNDVVPHARERLSDINIKRMIGHYFTDAPPTLAKLTAQHKAYMESPEVIADAKEAAKRLARDQRILDDAGIYAATLDFKDARAVLIWVRAWLHAADHIGVNWPREEWAGKLSAAGWVGGECCGAAFVKGDPVIEARWLIGQILSNMNSGMPPHPMCSKFINNYLLTFK